MKLIKRCENTIDPIIKYNIEEELNISSTLSSILINRGYDTKEKIQDFLYPNINQVPNPFLFNDMAKAVELINKYVAEHKKIVIYGDYDVDGVCSLAIMARYFNSLKANINLYVPDRHTEGYGLNMQAIEKIKNEKHGELIITVDCGITSVDEVAYAKELGMEVIVTDHHEPKEVLPDAYAIIDAKVKGEAYPFKELCGAGVATLLTYALSSNPNVFYQYLDLAALATVADVVPLVGANRYIVSEGLKIMNTHPSLGIRALSKYANSTNAPITSYMLGFRYAPLINASGRLASAKHAVVLFFTEEEEKAYKIAEYLYQVNNTRREIEADIYNQAENIIQSNGFDNSIILYNNNWNSGVIGIVASRLVEKYNVPAILFSYDSDKNLYHGSGRSITNINLFDVLSQCSEYIEKFGGHTAAAGISVTPENMSNFINKFNEILASYPDDTFEALKYYDTEIIVSELCKELVYEFNKLEPTGMCNSKPLLLLHDVSMKNITARGKEKQHFSSFVFDKTGKVEAIAFNQKFPDNIKYFDMLVTPSLNMFESDERFQIVINYFQESKHKADKLFDETTDYSARIIPMSLSVLGLQPKKEKQLNNAGIFTTEDLLNYFPKKYLDYRRPKLISEIRDKENCAIIGTIKKVNYSNKKVSMVYAICSDKSGTDFMACWFNQDYIGKRLTVGQEYIFCGNVKPNPTGLPQITPTRFDRNIPKLQKIVPVYKKIPGMADDYLEHCIDSCLDMLANTDYLTREVAEEFNLLSTFDTINALHRPVNDDDIFNAQRRKIFDCLFRFNFILKYKQRDNQTDSIFKTKTCNIWSEIVKAIPYELTDDQKSTIKEIFKTMQSGERLNALVQGDVGSGKTIVAFFALALAAENGFQSCLIAPTTVLAKQHFEACVDLLQPLGLSIAYLSGTTKAKERKTIMSLLEKGEIDIVVGTHAVIQDSVTFSNLGLVIVDEQHRFGVNQREKLLYNDREYQPHMITMSATPIPRTLSMAIYGDNIKVLNIKTKPLGRKPVQTLLMYKDAEIYNFIYNEIQNGHQAYIVCPLIEKSEAGSMAEIESVETVIKSVSDYFSTCPDIKISGISGKMKQDEINQEIDKFAANETQILISTTIIEVGVNVPNATVMVIKNSERFGLAQAHQLRGRVGRGSDQSYCILHTDPNDVKANILCNTTDGFEIAKEDMLMRGPGDFIGTTQTGGDKATMLMLSETDLYNQISNLNDRIFADKAWYSRYEYIVEDYLLEQEN